MKAKFWQAASCLLCAVVAWVTSSPYEGTEFSGGTVTGPLLAIDYLGIILFVIALVATFFHPRVAAAMILIAAMLCLPFYLYFTAPGPFRSVFRGDYTVSAPASFVWDRPMVAGIFTLLLATFFSLRTFRMR